MASPSAGARWTAQPRQPSSSLALDPVLRVSCGLGRLILTALQMRWQKPREDAVAHSPVSGGGWVEVSSSCMCTRECVCVWCVHWAIYVCTHKIFVWGAAPCMYVWHRCDVPRASPNLHIHACAYVHICCMSAVVCAPAVGTTDQDSSPATWGWVLVMEGLPTLVARCPGFSVLTPALLRPPTVSLANPGSRQIWMCLVTQFVQLFKTPWTEALQTPLSMGILQTRILE